MTTTAEPTRTIAFIHGAFVSQHCWDRFIPLCEARGYTCVRIAYPGREGSVAELKAAPHAPILGTLTLAQVVEHHVRALRALGPKPLVIGHSFGGLLTQLMLQRDVAAAGVAIDSVPPQGVTTLAWSFLRSLAPVVNPLLPASRPYVMSYEHFRYTFVNDLAPEAARAVYDAEVVPESRRLARGGLGSSARIDFTKPHAPLLMIAGGNDNIIPAALNRRNWRRYRRSPSVTDFEELPGRTHYSVIAGPGLEEVVELALGWAVRHGRLAPPTRTARPERAHVATHR